MDRQPEIVEIVGRFVNASNATLLGRSDDGDLWVYKPTAGERPLWDFPSETLAAREVLTYRIAVGVGLDVVPETGFGVGPFGPGAVQRFVDIDEARDPLELIESGDDLLWPIAVLDLVCNNADRKMGHIFFERGTGRLCGVDHGLNLHREDKLRTVLWAFAGQPLPEDEVARLRLLNHELSGSLGDEIEEHLSVAERRALDRRVEALLDRPVHPAPPLDRPAIPWPPY